ncbi:tetratricopeptide repeat protein [Sorangium cellulosum]|nr:tetratricopeptide repeat protein [Sorangium cellulosum]
MDHAGPGRLGELVRALLPEHPGIDVHVDPRVAETVPPGSTFVLVPRASDADWLNIQRPLFARRRLRVVLFCDRTTSAALARHAVDFFDWISVYVRCPDGAAPHAAQGIRCALRTRAPGVAWLGRGGEATVAAALSEALPGRGLMRIDPMGGYARMVEAIQGAGRAWVVAAAEHATLQRRIRWALAEARRGTRAIVVAPGVASPVGLRCPPALPGWWPVDDAMLPLAEARRALADVGAASPGRLAALAGLEPDAVELLARLIARGEDEGALTSILAGAGDPGAALAARAIEAGLIHGAATARGDAAPAVLRALARTPEGRRLAAGKRRDSLALWMRRPSARPWTTLAISAFDLGDLDAGAAWTRRALAEEPDHPRSLGLRVRAGEALLFRGEREAALATLERAFASARASLRPERPLRARAAAGFALALLGARKLERALPHLDRAIVAAGARPGTARRALAVLLPPFAKVLVPFGGCAEAEALLRSALGMDARGAAALLASSLRQKGLVLRCEPVLTALLSDPTAPGALRLRERCALVQALGEALLAAGRYDSAAPLLRAALRDLEEALGTEHPALRPVLDALSAARAAAGHLTDAEELGQRSSTIAALASGRPASREAAPGRPETRRASSRSRRATERERAREAVDMLAEMATAEETSTGRDAARRLSHALSFLPPGQRILLEMQLSGLTFREIAVALRMNVSTVQVRVSRALKALKKVLESPAADSP